jgi:hypothetical protein
MLQSFLLSVLTVVGMGFIAYGALNVARALRVKGWRPVPAVVIERQVLSVPVLVEQFQTAYYPVVRFRYETPVGVNESTRYSVVPKDYRSFDRLAVDKELLPYPVGAQVTAFLCPSDPRLAVLRSSVSRATMSHYLAVLLGGVLVVLACVAAAFHAAL